jgi:uncharacterized membrane protein
MADLKRVTRFLGGFSLGLGLPQTFSPAAFARLIGVVDDEASRALTRVVGVRELAAGVGILTRRRPVGWVWARVAGDAMDLTLLGAALRTKAVRPNRVIAAMSAATGITVVDLLTAVGMSRADARQPHEYAEVRGAITVRQPRDQIYLFWQDFENLPTFMAHLQSVVVTGDGRSHWIAAAPAGRTVEWDAEIVEFVPNELVAWQSVRGADVENAGVVRFVDAPGGRGTEIHLEMRYSAPGGPLGSAIARLFGEDPGQQVRDDLRRFKQVVETGEVIRSEGTPEGTNARRLLRQRPAQPPPTPAGAGAQR